MQVEGKISRSLGLILALVALGWSCGTGSTETEAPDTAGEHYPRLHAMDPPAAPGSMAPQLFTSRDGVLLTWLEGGAERRFELKLAHWGGEAWGRVRTPAAGERFFANWADMPSVVQGPGGTLVAHWLAMLGDNTYDYGVELTRSDDGGETWQALGLLHDDRTPAEHGFVSFVSLDDAVQAFWLDGRTMPSGAAMQLRTARLDAGDGFRPGPSTVLDERVCECCSTDAALTDAGPVVVYRDRGADEIRDISVVRAEGGGWSRPRTLAADDWQIHGCPVNGPAIAARGAEVAVAWFSAPKNQARVRVAFSHDSGVTFGAPVELDGEGALGRVDVQLDGEGHALVTWIGTLGDRGEIRLGRVSPRGEPGRLEGLVTTTTRRSAGVPRTVRLTHSRHGSGVALAWVEDTETRRVRVGFLPDDRERKEP